MKPYHLIETFSGKTIAKAETMEELRERITEKLADNYSIHHALQGWFAPATILFKEESQQAAG